MRRRDIVGGKVVDDHLRNHRHDLAEHLAAFLHEKFVRRANPFRRTAVQESEIVPDIVGEFGGEPGRNDFPPVAAACVFGALDHEGRCHIAEDEMAVAIAEVQMPRTDFGIANQYRARMSGRHHVRGGLKPEGGRGAGDIHVEAEALNAECVLHLHRHRGIGALHV